MQMVNVDKGSSRRTVYKKRVASNHYDIVTDLISRIQKQREQWRSNHITNSYTAVFLFIMLIH